jgi:hypothetical protein
VQPAGDPVGRVGVGSGLEIAVGRAQLGDRRDARVDVRERLDAVRAEALELRPPDGEQVVGDRSRPP